MKKKLFASVLILALIIPSCVQAKVYYPPQVDVYVHQAPDYGSAIGNLLNALINASRQNEQVKQQQELEKAYNGAMKAITDAAENEAQAFSKNLSLYGLDFFGWLPDWCVSKGFEYRHIDYPNNAKAIQVLIVDKSIKYIYEYMINPADQQCGVGLIVPDYDLRTISRIYTFDPPKPKPKSNAYAAGAYLGVVFEPEKTAEGYFTIYEVISGGIAEFAGFRKGDIITKIDTYDIREHDMERVGAYVGLRQQQRAILKVSAISQGTKKVIEIQL